LSIISAAIVDPFFIPDAAIDVGLRRGSPRVLQDVKRARSGRTTAVATGCCKDSDFGFDFSDWPEQKGLFHKCRQYIEPIIWGRTSSCWASRSTARTRILLLMQPSSSRQPCPGT
jgi:hypothetical protein